MGNNDRDRRDMRERSGNEGTGAFCHGRWPCGLPSVWNMTPGITGPSGMGHAPFGHGRSPRQRKSGHHMSSPGVPPEPYGRKHFLSNVAFSVSMMAIAGWLVFLFAPEDITCDANCFSIDGRSDGR